MSSFFLSLWAVSHFPKVDLNTRDAPPAFYVQRIASFDRHIAFEHGMKSQAIAMWFNQADGSSTANQLAA